MISALLAASPRLHELLGPDPAAWVNKAGADRALREEGTQIFGDEGWVTQTEADLGNPTD